MDNINRDKPVRWYHELSIVRWIFAVFGILIMLFAGGCTLLFFGNFVATGGDAGGYEMLVYMGFAVGIASLLSGLLIWWLAAKVGRQRS